MQGIVCDGLDAQLLITLMSYVGDEIKLLATVDTGFTSELTLPPSVIRELELKLDKYAVGILADGSEIECGVYLGRMQWQERWINIEIHETDGTPLLGMQLMQNSRLTMDIVPDGHFTILPLETPKESITHA